jgi:hypothetical protein
MRDSGKKSFQVEACDIAATIPGSLEVFVKKPTVPQPLTLL